MKPPRRVYRERITNRIPSVFYIWFSIVTRMIKEFLKKSPLINLLIRLKKCFVEPKPQNDEGVIIDRLTKRYIIPNTFIEFGFSGWEFNCAQLVNCWNGLLVDGDPYNVKIARIILPKNIVVKKQWLTLDNLKFIETYAEGKDIGILSIDVDGNDFWFLKKLISLRPAIIIAEYNSSFGLRPVTVPYDPSFDRRKKHESRTYFGASLSAIHYLTSRNGYSLIEIGNSGINAFFIRNDFLTTDDLVLKPESAFREKYFPDRTRPSQQWEKIKELEYVDVTQ